MAGQNIPDQDSVGAPGSLSSEGESTASVCATDRAKCSVIGNASTTLTTPSVVITFKKSKLEGDKRLSREGSFRRAHSHLLRPAMNDEGNELTTP